MHAVCAVDVNGTARHICVLALLAGCGGRSGLEVSASTEARGVDAGASASDAGVSPGRPRDAGDEVPVPRDGGPVEVCQLVPGETRTMFVEEGGSFDAPQVVFRGGTFDLLATFYPEDDDRAPVPYGSRYDARLDPAGGLSGPVPVSTPQIAAGIGEWLGVCYRSIRDDTAYLVGFRGDVAEYESSITAGRCVDLAGNGDRWLMITQPTTSLQQRWTLVEIGGLAITHPSRLRTRTPIEPDQSATVTAFRDGFAWALTPSSERELEVGLLGATGGPETRLVRSVPPAIAPPAIAPWAFHPEDALAVVSHEEGGVTLHVVSALDETPTGPEILRSAPFAFSMGGDVTPALLPRPDGMIVAMLNYGDFDPRGGQLEVVVLDRRGEGRSFISVPARRWNLAQGGVDIASDGDTIVVHWSDVEGDLPRDFTPVTRAMTLTCE